MRYTTKQMTSILTSKEAQQIVEYISPIYGDAYAALWLFQVIGAELDDLRTWVDDLKLQAFPQTATWSLGYWENLYQITTNSSLTTEQRQNNLLLKKLQRAPINPYKIQSITKAASGVPTQVEENTAKNTFTVILTAIPQNVNLSKVKAAIEEVNPAHLRYIIKFMQGVQTSLYYGGFISMCRKFTIGQVN
jgi:hypothetical protein